MAAIERVANAVGYQLVWLCAVAGAGRGYAWAGPVALLAFALPTLALSVDRARDLRLMLVCVAAGALLDGALGGIGWLDYASALPWPGAAPPWILSIWAAFALTLDRSLSPLRQRLWLGVALGAIGAPAAYASAAGGFDALAFGAPKAQVLLALAISWSLLVPLLLGKPRPTATIPPRREATA